MEMEAALAEAKRLVEAEIMSQPAASKLAHEHAIVAFARYINRHGNAVKHQSLGVG